VMADLMAESMAEMMGAWTADLMAVSMVE
jgi:hypothetical protein